MGSYVIVISEVFKYPPLKLKFGGLDTCNYDIMKISIWLRLRNSFFQELVALFFSSQTIESWNEESQNDCLISVEFCNLDSVVSYMLTVMQHLLAMWVYAFNVFVGINFLFHRLM